MTDPLAFLSEDARLALEELIDRRLEERLAALERSAREPEFLTVLEAAELLRARPQRVYDLLSDGRLTRHKDGSRVLVSRAELDRHIAGDGRRSTGRRRCRDL